MKFRKHLKLLLIVSIAWLLFWIAGLPDYYQQYSLATIFILVLAILLPIWYLVYRNIKKSKPGRGLKVAFWWTFYITVPLFFYDLIYCGIYLKHGVGFLWKYWYLTVYYIIPWLIFPLTGWLVERNRKSE
jgi:hypothetical protein